MGYEDRAFELFSEMQELPTPLIFVTTMMLVEEICKRRGYCPAEFLKECFEIKKEAEDFRMKEIKATQLKIGDDLKEVEADVVKLSDLLGVKNELDV